ncbi:N-acetylmuramoyl-L-alanine amidase [Thermoactinomyces sp. DSM 45891]|uniref:N-acetylmuramoyl-L-alanine amidase family protein n=1 Tax=Thermoactinomyces sp. DSM 45891 TaxID=1761907 RepID=UPI00092437EF|nr:N-acetylmuramoyl-L-alanine amidase [Thermoactinomyces sp. DSM 45891]SFX18899.1 N-acetylmuramoyl-L-alanine amidase [Thermoactinomyces sp. DSM 45891]
MGVLICLDPGHGGTDSGMVGSMFLEKDVCLDLAHRIERELQKFEGIDVTLTRRYDVDLTNNERAGWANQRKADLFVSLHTHGMLDRDQNGFSTYVSVVAGSKVRRVQCYLHNQVTRFLRTFGICDLGKRNDTESKGGQIIELRSADMPAITLALSSLPKGQHHELFSDLSFRDQYAKCIACGLANIYECQTKDSISS